MVISLISIFPRWPPSICASAASVLSDNMCGSKISKSALNVCLDDTSGGVLNQHYVWVIDQQRNYADLYQRSNNTNPAVGLTSRNGFTVHAVAGKSV